MLESFHNMKFYDTKYPNVGELHEQILLSFEKEEVYLAGHPLNEYQNI